MSEPATVRVRFAPSPTGYLHIGGARTCLFNWLFARKCQGRFILRIEDTDRERSKQEYVDEILESIAWLGMGWDEMFFQSQRFELYRDYAQRLIREGKATLKEGAVFFRYEFERVELHDLLRGSIVFNELPKQEEVIIKSDGSPTYNFSCVIDDVLLGINHVIRGEDHISNTPKQILMYKALGFELPSYAHVPLILSPGGGRLSKRFGATSIREYRQAGYLAEAIANYLLLLGWSPKDGREIVSLSQARDMFDIKDVNKTGAAFSLDKLNWVNAEYIRALNPERFSALAQAFLKEKQGVPAGFSQEYLHRVIGLFKERISTLSDLTVCTQPFFCDNIVYSEDTKEILAEPLVKEIAFLTARLKSLDDFSAAACEKVFRQAAEELGVKARVLVHPARVALTGSKHGPGLFETMEVLGKEKVVRRLEGLLSYWGGGLS